MASRASKRAARPVPAVSTATGFASWPLLLAGMALAVFVYAPSLQGPFVFDDFHLPFADPKASLMPAQFWIGGVRPVLMGSYWANYLYSGPGTYSYHAVNIALHLIAAALVWRILGRLLRMAFPSEETRWTAFLGAGIFLLHPLQTNVANTFKSIWPGAGFPDTCSENTIRIKSSNLFCSFQHL